MDNLKDMQDTLLNCVRSTRYFQKTIIINYPKNPICQRASSCAHVIPDEADVQTKVKQKKVPGTRPAVGQSVRHAQYVMFLLDVVRTTHMSTHTHTHTFASPSGKAINPLKRTVGPKEDIVLFEKNLKSLYYYFRSPYQ